MSVLYDKTVSLIQAALENAYYEGVKGNRTPDQNDAVRVTWRLVDLATEAVRERPHVDI